MLHIDKALLICIVISDIPIFVVFTRWCRSYFLHRGKSLSPFSPTDNTGTDSSKNSVSSEISKSVARLDAIYGKLLIGLRATVKTAFAKHNDVLEAGTYVQVLHEHYPQYDYIIFFLYPSTHIIVLLPFSSYLSLLLIIFLYFI